MGSEPLPLQNVIPSGERNLTFGNGITLFTVRDSSFVGEVPRSPRRPRDDKRLFAEQFAHERFLFFQLRHRLVDLVAAEIVERKFLHDLPFATANTHGKRRD